MRIAIYSSDLAQTNGRLMPWRTVLEVAAGFEQRGHHSLIFAGHRQTPIREWNSHGMKIIDLPKPDHAAMMQHLGTICREQRIELLYWPLAWWRPQIDVVALEKQGVRIVWYVPGAWYHLKNVLTATRRIGVNAALPYLGQALSSKRQYVRRLTQSGTRPLIVMTDYSRDMIIHNEYPSESVYAIPPGKAPLQQNNGEPTVFKRMKERLAGQPYFLFFGPPQSIRGVEILLSAFKQTAHQYQDVRLVCLFRSDEDLDEPNFKKSMDRLGLGDRLICLWESVSGADLAAFLQHCYAVVLPFLLIPSEIPLAVIEAAGYGKPVITTGPGGTGLFAAPYGLMIAPGDAKALEQAMLRLLTDRGLYAEKCRAAFQVYERHPTWDEVAERWLAAGVGN